MAAVSVTYAIEPAPARHPLAPGAAPGDIRAGLLAEDRAGFDAAYAAALEAARARLELTAVFATLEQWRWVAALQSDRADFTRVVRRAGTLVTGAPAAGQEPRAGTRARAGLAAGRGYRVGTDEASQAQLDALPPDGQLAWAELHTVLELMPETGRRAAPPIPHGTQTWVFGECRQGLLYYLVLQQLQRVEILAVRWCA